MAFYDSLRTAIRLHDDIESIGLETFSCCIFTNFRVPPLISAIPDHMLYNCQSIFSVEIPEDVSEIGYNAFCYCYCLRNMAFPPDAVFGDEIFISEDDDEMEMHTDLWLLFDSELQIMIDLQHRFDGLPIHKLVYYQTYHQGVLHNLVFAVNSRSDQTLRGNLDRTGNEQDCLGMTPLHILACSSVHDLEMYRVIVEKYPANLITEDRWGALPLQYAFWGAAPAEIIEFLLESYQALYSDYEFDWTMMVETIGRYYPPKESIENVLHVKQMHFPEQPIDWEYLLNELARSSRFHLSVDLFLFQEQMRFLFMCGISERMEALAFKVWHDHIRHKIQTADFICTSNGERNLVILCRIQRRIAHFEDELPKVKEVMTILELALWKIKMTMHENIHQEVMCIGRRKS